MKRVLAILLAVLCMMPIVVFGASAQSNYSYVVLDSAPKSKDDAIERSIYGVEIPTGKSVTLRVYSTGGAVIKAPAGGHVKWKVKHLGADENGFVKLTPSADGNSCVAKGLKGGKAYVEATFYDKNGKAVYSGASFVLDKGNVMEWVATVLTLGLYGINVPAMFTQDPLSTIFDIVLYYFNLVANPDIIM